MHKGPSMIKGTHRFYVIHWSSSQLKPFYLWKSWRRTWPCQQKKKMVDTSYLDIQGQFLSWPTVAEPVHLQPRAISQLLPLLRRRTQVGGAWSQSQRETGYTLDWFTRLSQGWHKRQITIPSDIHAQLQNQPLTHHRALIPTACLWTAGGSRGTGREPTQTRGEHADFHTERPLGGLENPGASTISGTEHSFSGLLSFECGSLFKQTVGEVKISGIPCLSVFMDRKTTLAQFIDLFPLYPLLSFLPDQSIICDWTFLEPMNPSCIDETFSVILPRVSSPFDKNLHCGQRRGPQSRRNPTRRHCSWQISLTSTSLLWNTSKQILFQSQERKCVPKYLSRSIITKGHSKCSNILYFGTSWASYKMVLGRNTFS